MLLIALFILCIVSTIGYLIENHEKHAYSKPIDDGIEYGVIMPFADEWKNYFKDSELEGNASPFQFWMRCVDREVRGWLFFEDTRSISHDKEATMVGSRTLQARIKLTADGQPVIYRSLDGGGDFFFNISSQVDEYHTVDIIIEGFRHYVRFPVNKCRKSIPPSPVEQYVLHLHLRDFTDKHQYKPSIIDGVANHLAYHRCALKLSNYEVVIQSEHLPQFLANGKIAHAVNQGWLTFLIRNPLIPSPFMMKDKGHNCYYQSYTENMAILRHWKENVRLYYMDSDEFMHFMPGLTSQEFFSLIQSHSNIGFKRYPVFKDSVKEGEADRKQLALSTSHIMLNSHILADPKLVVDPNKVGCMIVHWAQCGEDETKIVPMEKAFIIHFENMYGARWSKEDRLRLGTESPFVPTNVTTLCDPTLYDWKSALPSFHN